MFDILNEKVLHKKFGEGIIVSINQEDIIVDFKNAGRKKLQIPLVLEKGFLVLKDANKQSDYLRKINEIKEEKQKNKEKLSEIETKKRIEKEYKQRCNFDSRKTIADERKENQIKYFYVFQGANYELEKIGGYIWAPIKNEKGQTMHHWERMLDVREGDIILHGYDGYISAISIVRSKAYPSERPVGYGEDEWIGSGRKVDLRYYTLSCKLQTKQFIDDIKEFSSQKYTAFNVNGTGNLGYLFNIDVNLVKIFMDWIIKHNPKIKKIEQLTGLID